MSNSKELNISVADHIELSSLHLAVWEGPEFNKKLDAVLKPILFRNLFIDYMDRHIDADDIYQMNCDMRDFLADYFFTTGKEIKFKSVLAGVSTTFYKLSNVYFESSGTQQLEFHFSFERLSIEYHYGLPYLPLSTP